MTFDEGCRPIHSIFSAAHILNTCAYGKRFQWAWKNWPWFTFPALCFTRLISKGTIKTPRFNNGCTFTDTVYTSCRNSPIPEPLHKLQAMLKCGNTVKSGQKLIPFNYPSFARRLSSTMHHVQDVPWKISVCQWPFKQKASVKMWPSAGRSKIQKMSYKSIIKS